MYQNVNVPKPVQP